MLTLDNCTQGNTPKRGVYREKLSPPGEAWFKVVTSEGRVGTVHFPAELCDPLLEENLWKRLDAKDPQPDQPERHLKVL